jgi:predicted transcriptional regulator
MASLLDVLFGCTHKNCSFPITKRGGQRLSAAASVTGTYIVCLDCGKEFAYDWQKMKVISGSASRPKSVQAKEAKAA